MSALLGKFIMLPRLRFVVASLILAILPMLLLGSGVFPTPQGGGMTLEIPRAGKPVTLGPNEYSEAQYRQDRQTLAYARRATELSRLREMASVPLNSWIAAPDGSAPPATDSQRDNTSDAGVTATLSLAVVSLDKADDKPALSPAFSQTAKPEVRAGETGAFNNTPLDTRAAITPTPLPVEAALPSPVATVIPPPAYAALNVIDQTETLRTAPPPPGFFAPLPKPRNKAVRRPARPKSSLARQVRPKKPAPAAAGQAQNQAFADLFSWLFGPRITPAPYYPAAAAITPPTRTATR